MISILVEWAAVLAAAFAAAAGMTYFSVIFDEKTGRKICLPAIVRLTVVVFVCWLIEYVLIDVARTILAPIARISGLGEFGADVVAGMWLIFMSVVMMGLLMQTVHNVRTRRDARIAAMIELKKELEKELKTEAFIDNVNAWALMVGNRRNKCEVKTKPFVRPIRPE